MAVSPRMRNLGVLLALAACLLGVGSWAYLRTRPARRDPERAFPPDPRLAYQGPFTNVHPEVKYVGDDACVACHENIHRTYREHPMGRSVVPVSRLAAKQLYTEAQHNPFTAFEVRFRVDRQGDRVFHRQTRLDAEGTPLYDFAHEADFAVGSGSRGHSYLTVRDGFVFQTPVSWFAQKQIWDISPGFAPSSRTGRPIQGACLYCHANRVEPVADTRNRYEEPVFRGHAIGCERCHGPGERHVETQAKDDVVNPKHLEPALREAVCQQCHLEGAARVLRQGRGLNDFRPGMPLEEFFTVFVHGPGGGEHSKAVNHVEQMYQSACFQRGEAGKRMGCTTCHDPHEAVAPSRRVPYYRERCLQCHAKRGCSVPVETRRAKEPEDSCIACHVPRSATSDIAHVASSDHRIPRIAGKEPASPPSKRTHTRVSLVDFFRADAEAERSDAGRDLGVALYQVTRGGVSLTESDGAMAVRQLTEALRECPGDLAAWEAKGKILQTLRRPHDAIEAFEALLSRAPRHENSLASLGTIYRDLGRTADGLEYWRRAVEVNPWMADYRKNLVLHLADQNRWEDLRPHVEAWVKQDPASPEARHLRVMCLLRDGKKAEARAEFAKLRALRPPNQRELEVWFAEQVR